MGILSRVKVLGVLAMLAILILTLSILVVTRAPAHASSQTSCTHSFVSSPSPGSVFSHLNGVSAIASNDVWAVGDFSSPSFDQTLTEHWNGVSWSVKASPNPGVNANELFGVSAVSSTDVWAVGEFRSAGIDFTLTEHWNGLSWSVKSSPSPGTSFSALDGVSAISSNDVWAVGAFENTGGSSQTLTEHWNGVSWSVVSSPSPGTSDNFLDGVSAVSSSDVWAVGELKNTGGSGGQTLIEHWNGASWSLVPGVNVGSKSNALLAVTAVSSDDVWAVGIFQNTGTNQLGRALTEHWNGVSWSVIPNPVDNYTGFSTRLFGVAATNSSTAWTVGDYTNGTSIDQTLTERWTSDTGWGVLSNPPIGTHFSLLNAVSALKATSGPAVVWAVGEFANGSGPDQTLTELIVC